MSCTFYACLIMCRYLSSDGELLLILNLIITDDCCLQSSADNISKISQFSFVINLCLLMLSGGEKIKK